MSDFDDFFAKKLEDEGSFPNRVKNWKHLSKQLDAYQTGSTQTPRKALRFWQGLALVSLALAGALLWKTHLVTQENKILQQRLATRSLETSASSNLSASQIKPQVSHPAIQRVSTIPGEILPVLPASAKKAPGLKNSGRFGGGREEKQLPSELLSRNPENAPKQHFPVAANPNQSLQELPGVQVKTEDVLPGTLSPETSVATISTLENALQKIIDSLQTALDKATSAQIQSADSTRSPNIEATPAVSQPRLAEQDIRPVKPNPKRFRVGTQATIGFLQPRQDGVSALQGTGLSAEVRVLPSLWLSASVDWISYQICTKEFRQRNHPHHDTLPHPPHGGWGGGGGGNHDEYKLVLVESAPREQHFSLGFRYALPFRFWVQPSVRVTHEWVRRSASLITYKFEKEDNSGGPGPGSHFHEEFTAEKFPAQWQQNQWRFGFGLEKEFSNWAFGLWTDYAKDFSSKTPSNDVLYLRASAQYRF